MGIWNSILKYGGKAAKATGRSMGHAALHPSQTLRGTGQAVKTAAIGGAVGYVGWEKLTTDKSVVHIVSDAVIGEIGYGYPCRCSGRCARTNKQGRRSSRFRQRYGSRHRLKTGWSIEFSAASLQWRSFRYVR